MTKFKTWLNTSERAPLCVLVLLVLVAYCNVYTNQFIFDDDLLIVHNMYIDSISQIFNIFTHSATAGAGDAGGFYRPFQNILYMIVNLLFGRSVIAFHAVAVLLHAVNACLLYKIGCKLDFKRGPLLFATALWAVHPVHVEAITYMSGIADPLYALFSLWGILYLLPDFTPAKMARACVIYLCALFSKESAVTFPLLVMVTIFYCSGPQRWSPSTYLKTWPLWVTTGAYLIGHSFISLVPVYIPEDPYSQDISLRFFTFLATIPEYIRIFLWPFDLRLLRNFLVHDSIYYWRPFTGLLVLCYVAFLTLRRHDKPASPAAYGGLWFFAAFAIYSGILHPLNALVLEHWLYLSTSMLLICIAEALSRCRWTVRQSVLQSIGVFFIVACVTLTFLQNRVWETIFTLYDHIQKFEQLAARDYNNIAVQYDNNFQYDEAIKYYNLAMDGDRSGVTNHNYAFVLMKRAKREGRPLTDDEWTQAMFHFRRAIEITPTAPAPYFGIARLYEMKGDTAKAQEYQDKLDKIETDAGIAKH